jgi:hypothetical protein
MHKTHRVPRRLSVDMQSEWHNMPIPETVRSAADVGLRDLDSGAFKDLSDTSALQTSLNVL